MRYYLRQTCLLIMVLSAGCVPARKATKTDILSAEEALRCFRERSEMIGTLHGDGSITLESPEASHSGSFILEIRKPDSLKVDVRGPFGIRVGSLMVSRAQTMFYNYTDNTVSVQGSDNNGEYALLPIRISIDDLIPMLTGDLPAISGGDSLENFSITDNEYVLKFRSIKGKKEFCIDRTDLTVVSYKYFDDKDELMLTAQSSQIEDVDRISTPMFIRIVAPREGRSITIAYDDIVFNEPVSCAVTIPRHAKPIMLR